MNKVVVFQIKLSVKSLVHVADKLLYYPCLVNKLSGKKIVSDHIIGRP